MTQHIYLVRKDEPIRFPNYRNGTFCHVHFPSSGNTQLVHIYHYERGTWVYLSFYLQDMTSNN